MISNENGIEHIPKWMKMQSLVPNAKLNGFMYANTNIKMNSVMNPKYIIGFFIPKTMKLTTSTLIKYT